MRETGQEIVSLTIDFSDP